MKSSLRFCSALAVALAAGVASGCASQSNPTLPQGDVPSAIVLPQAGPPACKGQKNTKTYSSAAETLSSKGGRLCIPVFHAIGGSLEYPGANPSGKVTVTSTTINNGYPYPGSGTPIFYSLIALPGATTFGSTLPAGSGLTGKAIKAKAKYTVFFNYYKYGFWYSVSSCYAVAKPGKFGGVLDRLGALLKGQSFGGAYTLLFEVYPNQQTSSAC